MKAVVREEVQGIVRGRVGDDVGKAAGGFLDGLLGGKKKN
jgi:hypothetical protein